MITTTNSTIYYGVAEIKKNGKSIKISDAVFRPSGLKYEPVNNSKGFVPSEQGAMLKGKRFLARGDNVDEMLAEDNVSIIFSANTGHVFAMDEAVNITPPEISKDGFDVEYNSAESTTVSNG